MKPLTRSSLGACGFAASRQGGMSLLVVMVLLVIASILGVAASQIALQGERSARNDRDLQMALQSANLALQDANTEIFDPNNSRASNFAVDNSLAFTSTCGTGSGSLRGLCPQMPDGQPPSWLTVDLTNDAMTIPYGTYTNKALTLPASSVIGVQPAKAPRYVIERISPYEQGSNLQVKAGQPSTLDKAALYRVTAMGFGPRDDIIAVTQSVIRKPAN